MVPRCLVLISLFQAFHRPAVASSFANGLRRSTTCFPDTKRTHPRQCTLALVTQLQAKVDQGRSGNQGPNTGPLSFIWGALRGTGARIRRQLRGSAHAPKLLRSTSLRSASPISSATPQAVRPRPGVLNAAASASTPAQGDDLWLEEVDSEKALDWVRAQNANTFKALGDPVDSALYPRLKAIYESKDKIPAVVKRNDGNFYNFWQDADNPRGVWRRTTWEEYLKPKPTWEVLLDVDKLGKDEGQSWVWQGSIPIDLGPGVAATRCMVQLSPGGSDAVEMREFDLVKKQFVQPAEGGFLLPVAKSDADWVDADTLLIGTATQDPDSVTSSGYPRQIRLWKRGTQLSEAPVVFQVHPYTLHPTPHTLYPAPYTLHPMPYTLHPETHATPNPPTRKRAQRDQCVFGERALLTYEARTLAGGGGGRIGIGIRFALG
jgi:hypothetical protein